MMDLTGIDIEKYLGHSTRGASTSAAKRLGVSINSILKHASWRSATSSANFYDKDLDESNTVVASALLQGAL